MKRLLKPLTYTRLWRVFFGPKKVECVVYFLSPRSMWLGKPYSEDIIETRRFRTLLFAAGYGQAIANRFQRIDYVVRDVASGEFVGGHLPPCAADSLT